MFIYCFAFLCFFSYHFAALILPTDYTALCILKPDKPSSNCHKEADAEATTPSECCRDRVNLFYLFIYGRADYSVSVMPSSDCFLQPGLRGSCDQIWKTSGGLTVVPNQRWRKNTEYIERKREIDWIEDRKAYFSPSHITHLTSSTIQPS